MSLLLPLVTLIFSSTGSGISALRVDCEVERLPRGFFSGPKWVSLNSVPMRQWSSMMYTFAELLLFVKFHDMMSGRK